MRSATRIATVCAVIAALTLPFSSGAPHATAQARWIVKLGTEAFAHAPLAAMLTRVAEVMEREHPNRFWVKRITDGAMSRDKPGLARVAAGEAHGYAATYDELVAALPDAAALSAPFAFDDLRDADAVLRGAGGSAFESALAAQGLRLIAIGPCESRVLLGRSRALRTPKDASGATYAGGKDAAYAAFASALGLTPHDDAAQADARDATLTELAASGAFFASRHLTLTDHALECGALVLAQRWIDGLPAEMQKTLGRLSRDIGEDATKAQRATREPILKRAQELGVEIVTLDGKERRAWFEATRDARAKLNGEPGSLARKLTLAAQAK
jgi:TRAP-type C4-dicarboxylate transport system substrate-binding protein